MGEVQAVVGLKSLKKFSEEGFIFEIYPSKRYEGREVFGKKYHIKKLLYGKKESYKKKRSFKRGRIVKYRTTSRICETTVTPATEKGGI